MWTTVCTDCTAIAGTQTHALRYERPLQVSPTANWGDLTHPHGKPGYCGDDNILELHGENVGPQPGRPCAADKSRNVHPGCPSPTLVLLASHH